MAFTRRFLNSIFCIACFIGSCGEAFAQAVQIKNDLEQKLVIFGNKELSLTLDYNQKANISSLTVNGEQVVNGDAGIYSKITTKNATYSTLHLSSAPVANASKNTVTISGINYGDQSVAISETWTFTINANNIQFDISRKISKPIIAEKICLPVFMFNSIDTWEGAYQDYGGLAWFYLFNKKLDTYGVHSSSSRFFNSNTGNGLAIAVNAPGKEVAMDYSRTTNNKLAYTVAVSKTEMLPRFDSLTHRRRFVRDTNDIWAPCAIRAGSSTQSITLSYFNFHEKFDRGNLAGVNEEQVSAVLNTIARIGVIDKQHFGGNSWHTPYGPICLHEQYIAQMGLAINDESYLKGYKECLDFYRDNAVKKDGRVWARWAYSNEDAMPNQFTDKGFYEAQWGYLLDANPDFVTNVAELYDQNGDLGWIKTHQLSCEKVLDWIINRDINGNGLVEMMTDSHKQKRGSDWIDIIWASYENAFVNAKLYHSLILWADIERQLNNREKEHYYRLFAAKLKKNFNKPTTEGGFWDAEKRCYIHWRDKDGSVHGNNMVTPVNFMAIAYGICDDSVRIKTILDDIEEQMQKEKLFFWPICLYSYAPGEGNDWQFPFPNYENGDIFLSWGSVGVKAYASYRPELALKYVKKVLARYSRDGLAFQRYGRAKQDGLGDDILSGNSLAVVGLYQAIYGINPRYNRLYLAPHITNELAGTLLKYNYRGQRLNIRLEMNKYSVSNGRLTIGGKTDFGFFSNDKELFYFDGNSDKASLKVSTAANTPLTLDINEYGRDKISFTQLSPEPAAESMVYQANGLAPNAYYTIQVNKKTIKRIISNAEGTLVFKYKASKHAVEIVILKG